MKDLRRKLGFETLEDRRMKAGDIAAYVQSGNLYINEAAGQAGLDNGILISEVSAGVVRVQGIAPSGTGAASKVNGAAFQDFKVPGSLLASLGAGNDNVQFSAAGGPITLQSVDLNMGPVSIGAGVSDKDTVSVTNLHTSAGLSIETGADNDTVYVGTSLIGDDVGNDQLYIRTGAGSDYVSLQSSLYVHGSLSLQAYDALTENDVDTVYIDKYVQVDNDTTIATGGGNDNVYLGDVNGTQGYEYSLNASGSLTIDTGTGDDHIAMYDTFAGSSTTNTTLIMTGAGADTVDINGPTTWLSNLNLQTYTSTSEVDNDVVHIHSVSLGFNSSVRMGDGADQLTIDVSDPSQPDAGVVTTGSMYLDTGAGNDTVSISGMNMTIQPTDVLTIHTGAGQDNVNISKDHWLQGLVIQTYDSLSENDADSVVISDTYTHGAMSVLLGGGNDYFSIGGGSYSFTDITIDAGTGNDRGYDYGLSAKNQININMNDGDDILCVDSIIAHQLNMAGGNGYDHLGVTSNVYVDAVFESGWELYNHFNTLAEELKANLTTSSLSKVG